MAVLGIDWGEARLGVAVSDADAQLAFPAGAIERRSDAQVLAAIRELVDERGVERIVVGLPLHMDGRRGEAAEAAERFAASLRDALALPVETFDERWTTAEAERALRESPTRGRKRRRERKENVDALAATILLRAFLAARVQRNAGPAR